MSGPQFVVLLKLDEGIVPYGPIDDAHTAAEFAAFLSAEVDPATVRIMHSPTNELLRFWQHTKEERQR